MNAFYAFLHKCNRTYRLIKLILFVEPCLKCDMNHRAIKTLSKRITEMQSQYNNTYPSIGVQQIAKH